MRNRQVQSMTVKEYARENDSKNAWTQKINIYKNIVAKHIKDDYQFTKSIQFNRDSTINNLILSFVPSEGFEEHLEMEYHFEDSTKSEQLSVWHFYNDTITRQWININIEINNLSFPVALATIEMEFATDSLNYYRELKASPQVIEHYRNFAFTHLQDFEYSNKIAKPSLQCCTELISSKYDIIECIAQENHAYRQHWIDSTFNNHELIVENETHDYFYSKQTNNKGDLISIYRNAYNTNSEQKHYTDKQSYPFYQKEILVDPITRDTTYSLEMNSTNFFLNKKYVFKIKGRKLVEARLVPSMLSIISRQIEITTNKNGKIKKYSCIALSEGEHKLEFSYKLKGTKTKILIDRRTISNVSGKHIYNLNADDIFVGHHLYHIVKNQSKISSKESKRTPYHRPPFDIPSKKLMIEKKRIQKIEHFLTEDQMTEYYIQW